VQLSVASQRPGVNANRLASIERVDPLSGNPHLNGFPVTITPAGDVPTGGADAAGAEPAGVEVTSHAR
jgi:hypothetical protein